MLLGPWFPYGFWNFGASEGCEVGVNLLDGFRVRLTLGVLGKRPVDTGNRGVLTLARTRGVIADSDSGGGCVDRRPVKLVLDVLLMLLGALLGMAANYATSQTDHVPWPLRLLREWSVPLVAVVLLLLVAGQVWLHFLERPVAIARTWNSSQPPYPGLEAFTEDDGGVFFGRDREIRDLVGRLNPSAPARAHRFVAVIGPSGSGKSSLVRAGLLPALRRRRAGG